MLLVPPKTPARLPEGELPPEKASGAVRLLVFADLHFKAKNAKDSQTYADRLVEFAQASSDFDAIVCLGDALDGHRVIDMPSMNRVTRLFKALSRLAPLYILVGNHDRTSNVEFLSDESPFLALEGWPNVTLVASSAVLSDIAGLSCLFVPYVYQGRFAEAVGGVDLSRVAVIFAHQEFRGAVGAARQRSTEGDRWAASSPLVISGHYHDRQIVPPNIIYVGAAFQHTIAEDTHKGFSVFDFSSPVGSAPPGPKGSPSPTLLPQGSGACQWWFVEDVVEPTFVYTVSLCQLADFQPPEGRLHLIVEIDDETAIATADNLKKILELKQRGAKISYHVADAPLSFAPRVRMSFSELLQRSVKDDPDLCRLLKEILP